jgi:putative endonuclease
MKTKKRLLGDAGEVIAGDFLKNKGFVICDTNYQKPWGEIDIVAKKGSEIHFIEVKTQSVNSSVNTFDFYEAEERVDYYKRTKLRRIIETYLLEKHFTECDYCVDVLAIYLNKQSGEVVRIEYIEDIEL